MPKAFAKKIEIQNKIEIKAAVSSINDLNLQKKAFMSLVASNVLCEYLREQEIKILSENNSLSGLLLLKDFDIANITVENNIKIAVRAFVGDDYPQMCIPRSHFLNNILADIYVGVRLETTIENAEFVGFIEVDQINRQAGNDKYVSIDVNNLKSIDAIKQAINSSGRRKNSHLALDHEKARELFFQYIESRITSSDKEFFARHISSCTQCSEEFNHIIELDNMIKTVGHKFNFEENNNEDYTLKLFAGDPSLIGQEVEINLEEENIENNINQEISGQKKKKHLSGRKIGRAIKATGKLALLSGAVLGGGQLVSALQVANISGLVGSAALAMAASSAKGISESLSSVSEHFSEMALSGGNGPANNDNEKFNNQDLSFGESDNINNFDVHEEINALDNEVAGNFELNSDEVENIQDFDSHEEINALDNEVAGNFELNSVEVENIQDFDSHEEINALDNEVAGNFELNSVEVKNIQDFDSHEEINALDNEVAGNFELNSAEVENIQDFDSHEEINALDNEVAGNFELNSDEVENIQDFDSHEEINSLNEIADNVDLTGEILAEAEPLEELHEFNPNDLISEEIKENLPELQNSSFDLNDSIKEESLLENNNEDSIKLSEEESEVVSPQQEIQEVLHEDLSEETFLPEKEKDLDNSFDDIAIEYNIDDILSSFDNVEVVDSTNDFFDFDNSENVSSQEDTKQDKEQTENIIGEIYGDQKEVAAEHKVSPDPEKSYDFDDDFDEEEEQDQVALRKEKLRSIDLKVASGLVAAGIAVTVAVALWINNKTLTNQNLPVVNPQPVNQMGVLPNPDPAGVNNQNSNNIAMPPTNPSGQPTPVRTRKPLRSYTKQVKPKDIPPPNKDLSAVLAEAFTRRTYEVDIRNISWEITADMARNPVFKNYIMVTGQALKSALARDLSLANERALNTQMEIKTVMDLNGNILEADVVQSSGSQEVDKICLETYKTTIQFTKLPKINVNRDKIKANLIISF